MWCGDIPVYLSVESAECLRVESAGDGNVWLFTLNILHCFVFAALKGLYIVLYNLLCLLIFLNSSFVQTWLSKKAWAVLCGISKKENGQLYIGVLCLFSLCPILPFVCIQILIERSTWSIVRLGWCAEPVDDFSDLLSKWSGTSTFKSDVCGTQTGRGSPGTHYSGKFIQWLEIAKEQQNSTVGN